MILTSSFSIVSCGGYTPDSFDDNSVYLFDDYDIWKYGVANEVNFKTFYDDINNVDLSLEKDDLNSNFVLIDFMVNKNKNILFTIRTNRQDGSYRTKKYNAAIKVTGTSVNEIKNEVFNGVSIFNEIMINDNSELSEKYEYVGQMYVDCYKTIFNSVKEMKVFKRNNFKLSDLRISMKMWEMSNHDNWGEGSFYVKNVFDKVSVDNSGHYVFSRADIYIELCSVSFDFFYSYPE